ncbi:MAG: SUF system NifU family Fe-S cluster assembly protein [Candidatus Micrarchaeaceae archaeon]
MGEIENLYMEDIISNYEHPHNKGQIKDASAEFHGHNPVCGDDIRMYITVKDGKISDVKFEGDGCSISMASASMLTDFIKGKSLEEIEAMGVDTVRSLLKIDPGPVRLKCATLPLRTLKGAVFLYEHKKPEGLSDL